MLLHKDDTNFVVIFHKSKYFPVRLTENKISVASVIIICHVYGGGDDVGSPPRCVWLVRAFSVRAGFTGQSSRRFVAAHSLLIFFFKYVHD